MLAYASNRPVVAERRQSPHAMLAIVAGHVALVAVVMSARMDLPKRIYHSPLVIDLIQEDDAPPPPNPDRQLPAKPRQSMLDQPTLLVPVPPTNEVIDSTPVPVPDFDRLVGPIEPLPNADPVPTPTPVISAARLLTSASELKPPYPASKLASGEEALLRLKLTIDERGRVIGVEPIGRADRTFVEAARRHLMARWRYRPASENGRSVGSTAVITLRFQLEG